MKEIKKQDMPFEPKKVKSQVGASVFDDHDPNIVEKGGKDAATSVQ